MYFYNVNFIVIYLKNIKKNLNVYQNWKSEL